MQDLFVAHSDAPESCDEFGYDLFTHRFPQVQKSGSVFGYEASGGPLGVYQSAPLQFGERSLHCVGVDAGLQREIADGRET